jgi:hypothetical protein
MACSYSASATSTSPGCAARPGRVRLRPAWPGSRLRRWGARGGRRRRSGSPRAPEPSGARPADGAWSRVRPLLSDATPQYLGFTSVEYFLFDSGTRHRATAEAVGAGSLFALAPGKGFLAYRERNGTLHTYVQLTVAQGWLADIDAADGASVSARVAAEFDGWAPELTALITNSDTAPVARRLYTLPVSEAELVAALAEGRTPLALRPHRTVPSGSESSSNCGSESHGGPFLDGIPVRARLVVCSRPAVPIPR